MCDRETGNIRWDDFPSQKSIDKIIESEITEIFAYLRSFFSDGVSPNSFLNLNAADSVDAETSSA